MFAGNKTILFFGAHPDDIVLGAGATVAKLVHQHKVLCYTISSNVDQPSQKNLPVEDRKAIETLGVSSKNIWILDFKTRYFPRDRQEICDALWQIRRKHRPDMVFTHSVNDIHQDHLIMSAEVKRVFRDKTVFGIEVARSQVGFNPQLFIEVSKKNINCKIRALKQYKTHRHRNYTSAEAVRALSIARGIQLERKFVEAFEIIRYVVD